MTHFQRTARGPAPAPSFRPKDFRRAGLRALAAWALLFLCLAALPLPSAMAGPTAGGAPAAALPGTEQSGTQPAVSPADIAARKLADSLASGGDRGESAPRLVLLLNSYSQGMERMRRITDTLEDILAPARNSLVFRVENLDTPRAGAPEYHAAFAAMLAMKYAGRTPALILTSDDDALDFLQTHHAGLFPGIPVLFCGINHFDPQARERIPQLSGVLSRFSVRETAQAMLTLHPGIRRVVLVNDHAETGRAVETDMLRQLSGLPGGAQTETLPPMPFAALLARLAQLPKDAVVLLGLYSRDPEGYGTGFVDMGTRIAEASSVPVHCLVDENLRGAVVGGKLSSAAMQAEVLARLALRVLSGARAADIPITDDGVTRYMYRAPSLERWNIPEWQLPPESVVTDRPFSILRAYPVHVTALGAFLATLAATIAVLALMMRRKAASERRLRAFRNLLGDTLDSMPSIVIGVDSEGRVTHWNRHAAARTGIAPALAHSRPLEEVFPQLARLTADMLRATDNGQARDERHLLLTETDATRHEEVSVFPLVAEDAGGAVIRMDDVTERERLREMMVQTEKMITVGGLAAGMAHEINNPLGGILHAVQNIRRRVEPGRPGNEADARQAGVDVNVVRAYLTRRGIMGMLEDIATAGARAAHIVANMLDFGRRDEQGFLPQDLHGLIERTLELAASDYDLKKLHDFSKLRIVRSYAPDLPPVPCLPTEIEQVLLNLFKNAAQALVPGQSPNGAPPTLTIRTTLHPGLVAVTVSDNGPGMPPDVRARAFDPFYTTKPAGQGTGLGLSVSHFLITHNHGGCFALHTEPGNGASFTFTLPLRPR